MKKEVNKNGIIIGTLLGVIVFLIIIVILFATGTIRFNLDLNPETKNKEYLKGETITLKDNSKWLVLADSDENDEIVKLMNINDFVLYGSSCENQNEYVYCDDDSEYDTLVNEYFNSLTKYKGSKIESLINSYVDLIPVTLKEVDGYKIRLLSINDIFEYDNNWNKIDGNEYVYTGTKLNEAFLGAWTMDTVESRCSGNCGNFFVVLQDYNDNTNIVEKTYLGMGYSGLANIKPVIYVLKSSI